jgi:hypothetical protein
MHSACGCELKERKKQMSKTKLVATFIVALLATSIALSISPQTQAHTPSWQFTTYAYAAVAPNPVGVGQQTLIFGWLDYAIQGVNLNNDVRFHHYKARRNN